MTITRNIILVFGPILHRDIILTPVTPKRRWGYSDRRLHCSANRPSTSVVGDVGNNENDWPVHSLMASLHDLHTTQFSSATTTVIYCSLWYDFCQYIVTADTAKL